MKKIISLVLMLCIISACLPALCEAYGVETKRLDTSRIKWAMAMTADMAGAALDGAGQAETERERRFLSLFARTDYLSPDKAIVLEFDKVQMNAALRALGAGDRGWDAAAPALAGYINKQFSEDYARAAGLAQAEGETTIEYSKYFTMILLACGEDISVTSLTAYGHINSRSAFVISTREICKNLGEADIGNYIQQFGLQMPLVRVYEKSELDAMIEENPWGMDSAFNHMADALLKTPARRETLLPAWMQSGSEYLNARMKYNLIITMLKRLETADQRLIKELAGEWLPALAESPDGSEDQTEKYLGEAGGARDSHIAPPEVPYGEELRERDLKTGGTYLAVFDLTIPERDTVSWYDAVLESALPADRIPESFGSADYIIKCSVIYEGGVSSGGAHLHYPLTHVTVHDARTGELLRDLGSVKRKLSGAMMIGKGDTWWEPLYSQIWLYVRGLFEEQ